MSSFLLAVRNQKYRPQLSNMRCPLSKSMRFWCEANNIGYINLNPEYQCKSQYAAPSQGNTAMVQHLSCTPHIYHRIIWRFIGLMMNSDDVLPDPKILNIKAHIATIVNLTSQAISDEKLFSNKNNIFPVTNKCSGLETDARTKDSSIMSNDCPSFKSDRVQTTRGQSPEIVLSSSTVSPRSTSLQLLLMVLTRKLMTPPITHQKVVMLVMKMPQIMSRIIVKNHQEDYLLSTLRQHPVVLIMYLHHILMFQVSLQR